ncbi:hypothetical protein EIP91_001110 [Steccherinum ochraceum]|uniref:Carboxylic ester hydrolase n=1 Tax=Steccherinum ochraceum TaxID=92696 RepID=A0A4R0RHP0_9APHY|nr:hypothetical protein EIP91_001110 [Steccherinum ochraceum]
MAFGALLRALTIASVVCGVVGNNTPDISSVAPTIVLDKGTFVGVSNGNVTSFRGIPFAEPPVGNNRFRVPVANDPYTGVHSAANYGLACLQQSSPLPIPGPGGLGMNEFITGNSANSELAQGEDCLFQNVHIPANTKPNAKLPVAVWIFGGGFQFGATNAYNGNAIVQRSIAIGEPVVYVSMNYRLSAFGFLSSKEVNEAGVGNLGLQDQRLALRWVQKYVHLFGGDPTKVTIWGESAGALSVAYHLVVNGGNAEGLFRGAVMQSGSPNSLSDDPILAQSLYDGLVNKTGCTNSTDTLDCLRQVPAAQISSAMSATPGLFANGSLHLAWQPRVDGKFITDLPGRLAANGSIARVPFIGADVDDEGTIFGLSSLNVTDDAGFRNYITTFFLPNATSAQVDQVLQLYPSDPTQGSPFNTGTQNAITPQFKRMAAFLGDFVFQAPRRAFMQETAGKQDSWALQIQRGKMTPVLGSLHTSDISLAYGGTDLTDIVVNFVNHLKPNGKTVLQWPKYSASNPQMLALVDGTMPQQIINDTFRQDAMAFLFSLNENFVNATANLCVFESSGIFIKVGSAEVSL